MEKRLSVSFQEARYDRRRRQFTPTALASTDNRRRYDFGDVRVATLTLLTLTALSGERSCGVVIAKFSGQAVTLRSSPTVFADTSMSASTLTGI